MILLLGSAGYIGTEFVSAIIRRHMDYLAVPHETFNQDYLEQSRHRKNITSVICCAASIPKPSVSLCDREIGKTVDGNVIFPMLAAEATRQAGIPFVHLSTGCLFDDQREYTEDDAPLRGFKDHCGVYVGTKLIAEQQISKIPKHYILRIRLPFDEQSGERNYLSKLIRYPQVYDHLNSLTHRGDFVNAALDLVEKKAPFGTYHMVNPGSISAREIVAELLKRGMIDKEPEFVPGPCEGCTLSTAKLLATGVKIRPVREAVMDSLDRWKP